MNGGADAAPPPSRPSPTSADDDVAALTYLASQFPLNLPIQNHAPGATGRVPEVPGDNSLRQNLLSHQRHPPRGASGAETPHAHRYSRGGPPHRGAPPRVAHRGGRYSYENMPPH